jgi:hypothetical protein
MALFSHTRRALSALAGLTLVAAPAAGEAPQCKLCSEALRAEADRPLDIEISTGLEFSRLARTGRGDGVASLDPQSGAKRIDQGLVDLGGFALTGRARVSGTPSRAVRILLPASVTLRTPQGDTAELTDLATDLPAVPVLDASGGLEFSFGGRLRVTGASAGNFRGRIPIGVEYD